MNRRQKRFLEREYNKNKAKLIHNLKELNIPTEQDVEEYIKERTAPKIIQPITVIPTDEIIKEYYNFKSNGVSLQGETGTKTPTNTGTNTGEVDHFNNLDDYHYIKSKDK